MRLDRFGFDINEKSEWFHSFFDVEISNKILIYYSIVASIFTTFSDLKFKRENFFNTNFLLAKNKNKNALREIINVPIQYVLYYIMLNTNNTVQCATEFSVVIFTFYYDLFSVRVLHVNIKKKKNSFTKRVYAHRIRRRTKKA